MALAEAIVRRRAWLAAGWLGAAALLLPSASRVARVLDVGATVDGSESAAVERLLRGPLVSAYARYAVLVIDSGPSPASARSDSVLGRILAVLTAAPEVSGTFSFRNGGDSLFLAPRGTGTFVVAGLATTTTRVSADEVMPRLRGRTEPLQRQLRAEYPELTLRWTGESALNHDLRESSNVDVGRAERRALPLIALFLVLVFGAVAAALVPVLCGALAIAIALGLAAIVARFWPVSILLQSVVTMLGLGLGIDYALLTITRFREGLTAGRDATTAAVQATRHAGHTILVAATTVAIGFVALLLVPLNEMRAIAVGGLLVVLTSALLATTLLPGLLAWLGPRVDWGRVRRPAHASGDRWRRLGHWVTARPWLALAGGGVPLLVLALQAAGLRTGLPRGDWLPPAMESAVALRDLRAMGRSGIVDAVRVVLELPEGTSVRTSAGWRALRQFVDPLERDPRVERVRSLVAVVRATGLGRLGLATLPERTTAGLVSRDGRLTVVELMPRDGLGPDALGQLVREIRAAGGAASGLNGAVVRVGGLPAFNTDYRDAVVGRFAQIAGLVVLGTLVALFLGTRSLLVPLKAMLLNLLSVGAAFGALTLVFQDGLGSSLFGVPEPLGAVFSTLPVIVFCLVFGLSMDYEVFLITRVMEGRRSGLDDRTAIIEGIASTGPVITNAAAIMLVVFAAFTLGQFLVIKLLGFTLAVAVLLDATVVRMVIGPALLQLAGRWNWWPGTSGLSLPDPAISSALPHGPNGARPSGSSAY
jgi:RND superfamily putative drug exporter